MEERERVVAIVRCILLGDVQETCGNVLSLVQSWRSGLSPMVCLPIQPIVGVNAWLADFPLLNVWGRASALLT